MTTKVLITGATGNVGMEIIRALHKTEHHLDLCCGIINPSAPNTALQGKNMRFVAFDFTDRTTYEPALRGCDVLFLLRPPEIADVQLYFKPIIDTCKKNKCTTYRIFIGTRRRYKQNDTTS